MPTLISASRRTDIPRYYGRWFAERRTQGFAEFCNVFGGKGRVSLRNPDVLGYLFWTRYAKPFTDQLRTLHDDGLPYAFQYTITGLGREIEPQAPRRTLAIDDFLRVSRDLPDPTCIQWRYDPIILSARYPTAFHRRNFTELACALEGATRVVNTSVVEPYARTIRRTPDPTIHYRTIDPSRHSAALKRHPGLVQAGKEVRLLLADLAGIAAQHGMELRSCSNPEWPLSPSQCCGVELFAAFGQEVSNAVAALDRAPSRNGCRCLKMVDIGMDNTCVAGCTYCYVVNAHQTAVANRRRHDPTHSTLR